MWIWMPLAMLVWKEQAVIDQEAEEEMDGAPVGREEAMRAQPGGTAGEPNGDVPLQEWDVADYGWKDGILGDAEIPAGNGERSNAEREDEREEPSSPRGGSATDGKDGWTAQASAGWGSPQWNGATEWTKRRGQTNGKSDAKPSNDEIVHQQREAEKQRFNNGGFRAGDGPNTARPRAALGVSHIALSLLPAQTPLCPRIHGLV
ncbi:hypothetical protein niasHT_011522 [Heterodera trifolii]|uniref:Uncharacterized protein n=1 Tax=Heterodera trifolii TaxID=157864 RepID=A0ABD2LG29_9BILA